jgi:hypothetical protein
MVWTPHQMSFRCKNREGRDVQAIWHVWETRELYAEVIQVVKNSSPLVSVIDTVVRVM